MDFVEPVVNKSLRVRMNLWARVMDECREMEFKSENELLNFLIELGLDSMNGKSDDDASSSSPELIEESDDDASSSQLDNDNDDDASSQGLNPKSDDDASSWDLMEV